jgi:hypothetical protein
MNYFIKLLHLLGIIIIPNLEMLQEKKINVFTILKNNLKTNICGIGCAAYILHNAMQTSKDILPIDVECTEKQNISILSCIYIYIYIYIPCVHQFREH